ncbi:MAG: TrmH family RNA methyltransferase [Sciscionella sp.]
MTATITSVKDPHIAQVRALCSRAAREAQRRCVIEGALLIEQAMTAGVPLEFVLTEPDAPLAALTTAAGVPAIGATPSVLRQALRSQRPITAIAIAPLPAESDPDRRYGQLALVLDGIADPGNLGTVIRTACGLGAPDIVCTDRETDLSSRRVLDASRCAVLRVAVHRYPNPREALKALRGNGFEVVVSSPRGSALRSFVPRRGGGLALVLGNETVGVSDEVLAAADAVLAIPMAGDTESLNVGVAAGIAIYALRQKLADQAT